MELEVTSIVVTGGNGMLGHSLIPKLLKEGHLVTSLGRTLARKTIVVDYSSLESTHQALDEINPDFIVNLAALTDVDQCERCPHDAYTANVSVVEILVSWIRKNNHCHLIQISTDQVYDGSKKPIEKNIKILNYYPFSKYAGEIVAQGVDSTILRTNFFGKSLNAERQSFSDWAVNGLRSGRKIFLLSDVFFSPLSMNTLCSYICHIIKNPIIGTFNLGSKKGLSKANFVICLAKLLEKSNTNLEKGTLQDLDLIAPRPLDMRMDCSKFESTFNLELPNLDEEIKSIESEYVDATR